MHRAVALLPLLAACTVHKDASTLPVGDEVTILTVDRQETVARVVPHPTEITFQTPTGQIVNADRVVYIEKKSHARGAWHGMLAGAVAGFAVGAVIGYSDGDDECTDFCILTFTAEDKAVLAGSALGIVGGLGGVIVGAIVGSREIYSFGGQQEYRLTPSGPPGSTVGATITF